MTLLNIDKDMCKQDGLCAADCPTGIIYFKDKNHYPRLVPKGETMCLRCGHCVAVCPHGAMDHAEIPLEACPPIDKALTLNEAQAEQFLRSRRSVRQFKKRDVERDVVQRLIEIARHAPTGSNLQLVEWVVINGRERLREISGQVIDWMRGVLKVDPQPANRSYMPMLVKAWDAGQDTVLRDAPCLVVAMAPKADHNGLVNLTLALSYLELAAPVFGLGTCWAGLLQGALLSDPDLKSAVHIPDGYPHHYALMVGYSRARYYRLPARKAPKIHWK